MNEQDILESLKNNQDCNIMRSNNYRTKPIPRGLILTDEQIASITSMKNKGVKESDIALILGMPRSTLNVQLQIIGIANIRNEALWQEIIHLMRDKDIPTYGTIKLLETKATHTTKLTYLQRYIYTKQKAVITLTYMEEPLLPIPENFPKVDNVNRIITEKQDSFMGQIYGVYNDFMGQICAMYGEFVRNIIQIKGKRCCACGYDNPDGVPGRDYFVLSNMTAPIADFKEWVNGFNVYCRRHYLKTLYERA